MTNNEADIPGDAQRVWLAVLGKHPGWNDHLDDIGLDTERLVAVKRSLYVDSIGGLIDAGKWESLDEAEHDDGFAHTFFWRQPDGMVIGRMWSSSDGKGRRKYPMIACAMCRSLPFAFVAGPLLDRLRGLESTCKGVSTAAAVIAATDRSRLEIADLASHVPELSGQDLAQPASAAALIDSGVLGEDGVGLKRVLYQIDRELGAYIRPESGATASRSRSVEIRGQHLRVPSPEGDTRRGNEHACLGLWSRLLLTKLDPLVPMFMVVKDDRSWVDIVVGELGPASLACLQMNSDGIPYGSDIPFTIDGESEAAMDAAIAASRSGGVAEKDPCFVDAPLDRLAPFLRPRRTERKEDAASKRTLPVVIGLAIVAVLIIVVVGSIVFGGGSGETRSDADESDAESGIQEPQAGAPDTTRDPEELRASGPTDVLPLATDPTATPEPAGRLAAFTAWCDSYRDWFQPFITGIESDRLGGDPEFARGLQLAIDRARATGDAADPLRMTPGRFRSLQTLRDTPPDEIYDAGFDETILQGARIIDGVRGAFDADAWPTRSSLTAIAGRAEEDRGTVPPEVRELLAHLAGSDGAAAADAVTQLSQLTESVETTETVLDAFDRAGEAVAGASVGTAARAFKALSPFTRSGDASPVVWLDGVAARAEELTETARRLVSSASLVRRVDPGLLEQRMEAVAPPESEQQARVHIAAWLDAINDRTLYLLDPAADPRRGMPGDAEIAGLRTSLAELATEAESAETRELSGMIGVVAQTSLALRELAWNEATKARVTGEAEQVRRLVANIRDRIDAEQRTRAFEAESYLAELQATDSVTASGSEAIDAAWVAWRDRAVGGFGPESSLVQFSRTVDRAKENLSALERVVPRVPIENAVFARSTPRIEAASLAHRESALAAAATAAVNGEIDQRNADAYAEWADGVISSGVTLGALRDLMGAWSLPDDDAADGPTPRALATAWSRSWAGSAADLSSDEQPLGSYVAALSVTTVGGARALIENRTTSPAALMAAWAMLGTLDPAWGEDPGHAAFDAAALERIRRSIGDAPAERSGAILAMLSRESTERWMRGVESADAAGFPAMAALADRLGIDESRLPVHVRFNLFVADLRASLNDDSASDRESLLGRIRAIRPGTPIEADRWLAALEGELASREGREVDYRVIGPGRAGWTVQRFDSGRVLVYTWPGATEDRRLAFRLVESDDAGVFYLAVSEAPAWLLTEFALEGQHAESIVTTMPPDWHPLPDTRLGPRGWTWGSRGSNRELRRARTWVPRSAASDRPVYPEQIAATLKRPDINHPVQRVSPRTAAAIAAAAGCRLPSGAEWRAAYATTGSPPASDAFNLRDSTFEKQRVHTASLGAGIAVTWPDQQSYSDGVPGIPTGRDAVSHAWTDNVLWFAEIGGQDGGGFGHLVGNVAEFVLPVTPSPSQLTDRILPVADHVQGLAGAADLPGVGIIGGSALSDPSLPLSTVARPDEIQGIIGFSDVGFRLAFSPGVEAPLVVVLGESLDGAPYLRSSD